MRAYRLKSENELAVVVSLDEAQKVVQRNEHELTRLIGWIKAALDDKS